MTALLDRPFLTELDSRAAIKGSRDPLGIQPIWTRLGRHVVGNLTTVSNSVLDFKVLLLGRWFAEELTEIEQSAEDVPANEIATFLKWEQLAAYVRCRWNKHVSLRGIERVRKTLNEGTRVTLSDSVTHQILGNQQTYGLWGLYTMPARASGLLDGEITRLSAQAREFIEEYYVPALERGAGKRAEKIFAMLRKPSCTLDVEAHKVATLEPISELLGGVSGRPERDFYWESLVEGGPNDKTGGRQRLLAELVTSSPEASHAPWSPALVSELAKKARRRGDQGYELATGLERIRTTESVTAPSAKVFGYLIGLDGKTIQQAADCVTQVWGERLRTVDPEAFRAMCHEIDETGEGAGNRWATIGESLASGAYQKLVELLVEQNRAVMSARGGASWIEIRNGRLDVRFYGDRPTDLPARHELPNLWTSPYFLGSLRSVARTLKEA